MQSTVCECKGEEEEERKKKEEEERMRRDWQTVW